MIHELTREPDISADPEAMLIEVMARSAHAAFHRGRDRWAFAKPLVQERFRQEARASAQAIRENRLGRFLL